MTLFSVSISNFRFNPGVGNLATFSQFVFVAGHGLIFTSKFFTVKRNIELKDYMTLVSMFFISNVCSNYSLNFYIPMPLHMIFRAGSLLTNMIMGILILKKSYDFWKYFSVTLITVGIILCTAMSGLSLEQENSSSVNGESFDVLVWWSVGICLLAFSLLIAARMGIYQETLFKKYGKHAQEALFYTHLLPLSGFLLMINNIRDNFLLTLKSENLTVLNVKIPEQLVFLIVIVLTNYICISSVYVLSTECSSLTVTLVVTLRKFLSLFFSIIYFKNPFTLYHWIGTGFVIVGTVIFTEVVTKVCQSAIIESPKIRCERRNKLQQTLYNFCKKTFMSWKAKINSDILPMVRVV